jgi:hypothetical protein
MSHPPRYRLASTVWLGLLNTLACPALRRRGHVWGAGTLLLLAGGQPQLVQAQASVTVSGTVQDETSGESLPEATVCVLLTLRRVTVPLFSVGVTVLKHQILYDLRGC